MSIGPAFALYLVGTDPSTNLYVGLALVGFAGLVIALNARYESKWQTLPSSSAYRIKMETGSNSTQRRAGTQLHHSNYIPKQLTVEKYPEGDQVSKRTLRDSFNIFEPRALPGAIPQMIMCPTFGFGVFFAGLYGTTLGYTHAGLFYTISAVSMIIIRMISKHFMDTVPAIKTMTGAVACGILCCLMLLAAPYGEPVFLASGIFYGLATGISLPLNQSVAVKNTPPERWGAANALFLLANDIGIGFASVIWALSMTHSGSRQASSASCLPYRKLRIRLDRLPRPRQAVEALERKRQNDRVAGNVQGHSGIRMEKSWTFPSLRCGMP